ncbi:NADPH-dependent 2,4-dienoyl-CoA reductase, sulfur reductase [Neorhodopirellula lusitana]|uniref:NADPH-dependent 2,4-dienoyl-CoA reductase, sulfur reductase n=1 Tax=Neorhodopirellula lusitana TaxID=445327 RepID=A0ABY1PXH1_9BACT|nr:FAD-dependent oxidoreductase [Neorhodopirellula lusitana]SMP46221.1 NADPH-dependent 2,4-dienoyl-CoA reductase, sulfur reductase [Neorhodopirellula lusitana]
MKIVIVGGVAGGASAAARARRLCDNAEIIVLERGHYPSFANCGLPYYVGGKIQSRNKLLVAPIDMLRQRHRLDVRIRSEVVQIDRDNKQVSVRNLESGEEYTETYDKLIIATGASPFRPPLPGIDGPRVLELRDLNDADRMYELATSGVTRATIVGAGFIGIEVAENLVRRGIHTTIVELSEQVLPPWDQEMIAPIDEHIRAQGVDILLGESATSFDDGPDGLTINLKSGQALKSDFAVVCIGVRPESQLAADAGIQCGDRGGIIVTDQMQTNDPDIYAVGDVTQVSCFVSKTPTQIPLAGPANRQGRIAADHIFGRQSSYRGTQGTAVVGVFEKTAAMTGLSEKQLKRLDIDYEKVYIHPANHAGYYPGAEALTLKLIYAPKTGVILGAQAVGGDGVDKRIDVIAMAIQGGMTVEDLEEAELCYAPQYGHAKDPINMAGFVAAGVIRGDQPVVHVDSIDPQMFLLDVRSEAEFAAGHIPGATNIPIEVLREHTDEVPKDKTIAAYCKVGQRGYLATRVLMQRGFNVVNISGGYTSWLRSQ